MQSIFRNIIEDCTLFVSTELLVDLNKIEYCENNSKKIKKLFCKIFKQKLHNPGTVWEQYTKKFGIPFNFDI